MKLKLQPTAHSYYCIESNYYVDGLRNYGKSIYETWGEFKEGWMLGDLSIDHDYNHCFRFDIKNKYNSETDEESETEFSLHLYFILQRKGNFIPVEIRTITEEDMEEVNAYLEQCWKYLKNQWIEFQ